MTAMTATATAREDEAMHLSIFENEKTGTDNEYALAHSAVEDALNDARSHNLSSFKDAFLALRGNLWYRRHRICSRHRTFR